MGLGGPTKAIGSGDERKKVAVENTGWVSSGKINSNTITLHRTIYFFFSFPLF